MRHGTWAVEDLLKEVHVECSVNGTICFVGEYTMCSDEERDEMLARAQYIAHLHNNSVECPMNTIELSDDQLQEVLNGLDCIQSDLCGSEEERNQVQEVIDHINTQTE